MGYRDPAQRRRRVDHDPDPARRHQQLAARARRALPPGQSPLSAVGRHPRWRVKRSRPSRKAPVSRPSKHNGLTGRGRQASCERPSLAGEGLCAGAQDSGSGRVSAITVNAAARISVAPRNASVATGPPSSPRRQIAKTSETAVANILRPTDERHFTGATGRWDGAGPPAPRARSCRPWRASAKARIRHPRHRPPRRHARPGALTRSTLRADGRRFESAHRLHPEQPKRVGGLIRGKGVTATSSAEGSPSFRRALLLIPPLVDLRKLACGKRESMARKMGKNCPESGKYR
jgi:hypothetical protein